MSDLVISVDPNLERAPYRQIYEQLRAAMERGELSPGTALPTVRQLANDLNVAPNTVARAYADLQNDGWLVSEGRRGTRVAERVPAADKRTRTHALRNAVEEFVASLAARGYTRGEIAGELRRLA